MKAKHLKKTKKKILSKIIILVFLLIFIYSTYQVGIWLKGTIDTQRLETAVFPTIIVDNEQNKTVNINYDKLEQINSDIIAWIKIRNTNINYPVLQGETDEFYLRKDIYKNYNFSGSIFVDSSTKQDFSDENTVIYGHNLKNKKMFSDLTKIYNGSLGNTVDVEIYQKNGIKRIYNVISTYMSEQDLAITKKSFAIREKEEFINNAIQKSNVKFEKQIDYTKNILTLVTCDKTGDKRIIVTCTEK